MKFYLKTAAWISTGIAIVLMLIGIIAKLSGGAIFNHWWGNYYYPSHNFLLLGVVLLLFAIVGCEKKEK
jgi:uncharacterized membrane protein